MHGPSLRTALLHLPSLAGIRPLAASTTLPSSAVLEPMLILALCIVAGLGTVMLLPNRGELAIRKIGGAILAACLLILGAVLLRTREHGAHVYFWIFSAIALVGAVRVITHPRPVYSALYFVLTVFATAGLFILLWAEFMAAALVLIYAGAILITYVFVIMLASQATSSGRPMRAVFDFDNVSREPFIASAVGFALMGVLLFVIFDRGSAIAPVSEAQASANLAGAGLPPTSAEESGSSVEALGRSLFYNQLLNLELAGLILTVSTVGAIMIARRRVSGGEGAFEPTSEAYIAPATPIDDNPHSIPVYASGDPQQKNYPER